MATHPTFKMFKGKPDTHKIVQGEVAKDPLEEQIFPEEWDALDYLRSVCDLCKHYDDEFLFACLWARKMDISRTIDLVEHNWKWRVHNGFETLPECETIDWTFLKNAMNIPGTRSREGYGIIYSGMIDPTTVDIDEIFRYAAWYHIEGMFHAGMDVARNGVYMVQDLDGFGWKHFDMKFQKKFMEIYQDNFPMRLKKSLQINAPSIVKACWALMKPFVKKKMMDRFSIGKQVDILDDVGKEELWDRYAGFMSHTNDKWLEQLKEYGQWYRENRRGVRGRKPPTAKLSSAPSSSKVTKAPKKPDLSNYDM